MAISLSSLKKREIRRKIVLTNELGEKDFIIVRNPNEEEKIEIMKFVGGRIRENESEMTISPKDVMETFLPMLTNVEIDVEDMEDIIANPSPQLVEVHYHIAEIIQEIINEMLMQQSSSLSLASQTGVINDIETKVEKIIQDKPKKKGRPAKSKK